MNILEMDCVPKVLLMMMIISKLMWRVSCVMNVHQTLIMFDVLFAINVYLNEISNEL